ncbi:MAG: hypothetical protein K6D96_06565 [Acetatifactor sp.]|nr:hypothetical protein [Acetatifactor sp.]
MLILVGLALLVALLPLFRIGMYSVPWYDDYGYAKPARDFMVEYGRSFFNAVRGSLYKVKVTWYSWQGTFSSVFLMGLSPIIWGEEWHFLGSWFLIIMLTLSSVAFTYIFMKRIIGFDFIEALTTAFFVSILMIVKIHTACHGFYWFNAGVHYVGMHSFMMIFLASIILAATVKKAYAVTIWTIICVLLAVVVSGSNFVTALQGMLFAVLFMAFVCYKYGKRAFIYIPVMAVYAFGFYKNVTAPGNDHRAAYYVDVAMGPVKSVLMSFYWAVKYLARFTDIFTVLVLIMLIPVIIRGLKNSDLKFRWPGLVFVLSFCLYATGYTPSLYGMGSPGLARTLNAVKFTYEFLLIFNEIYFIGWLKGILSKKGKEVKEFGYWWIYAGSFLITAFLVFTDSQAVWEYSPYGAYYYIHTGEALNFQTGYLQRIDQIKSEEGDVAVGAYVFRPTFLCVEELSEDPTRGANVAMAEWYGKNSIVVKYVE